MDGEIGVAHGTVGGVAAGGTVRWATSAAGYGGLEIGRYATNADAGAVGNEAFGVSGGTNSANTVLTEPSCGNATSAGCGRSGAGEAR